ncbi:uncharacterized protein LOC103975117 [Musa acuminata AAA Group]|uniref:uncharacterized protein LOC103975117 n=1 Tax=Musa acuminata AAA Group TaxID=214697 RepID=UPI0031DA8717
MERRGGCCIAMYGGGGDANVAWKVDRIMLKFRPIAPKPVVGSPTVVAAAPKEASAGARRPKRKGPAISAAAARGRKPRKVEATPLPPPIVDEGKSFSSSTIVTLPLMPETPERKGDPAGAPPKWCPTPAAVAPAWMGLGEGEAADVVVAPRPVRAVVSWVTVECVTDTWREGEVSWRNDKVARAALAADECPGFVSDEWGGVTWTNEAYRRMVLGEGSGSSSAAGGVKEEEEEEVRVKLVARGLVPAARTCRAFTCRVRVRHAERPKGPPSLAAPCDVWRLDGGGCAWRLDVKAALSLSV